MEHHAELAIIFEMTIKSYGQHTFHLGQNFYYIWGPILLSKLILQPWGKKIKKHVCLVPPTNQKVGTFYLHIVYWYLPIVTLIFVRNCYSWYNSSGYRYWKSQNRYPGCGYQYISQGGIKYSISFHPKKLFPLRPCESWLQTLIKSMGFACINELILLLYHLFLSWEIIYHHEKFFSHVFSVTK